MRDSYVLTLACANRPGIVSVIATKIFEAGGDILDAQHFDDEQSGQFFMRVVFAMAQPVQPAQDQPNAIDVLHTTLTDTARHFAMVMQLRKTLPKRRVIILVSRFDHCLVDLLYRQKLGELPMEIVAIIANYPRETYQGQDFGAIPFYYLPVDARSKPKQEADIAAIIAKTGAEFIILARYMQVLSPDFVAQFLGRCINIHHSFLPGFKGAKPYHQAFARGVKLIGATAHFVTADLDEGPIIEQDVERISHSDQPEDLVRKGRDIERRVLARAVRNVLEDRVLLNGQKTVVFGS